MLRQGLLVCAVGMAIVWQTGISGQVDRESTKEQSHKRFAELIASADGTYTRIADGVWQTAYKGKNMPIINVRIATAEGGVLFFVDLFERSAAARTAGESDIRVNGAHQ